MLELSEAADVWPSQWLSHSTIVGKNSKSSQFYKTGFKADIYPQYLYMNLQESVIASGHVAAFQGMSVKNATR